MDKEEILKELKGSLEVTWLKRRLLIHTPIYCAAGALFALAYWGAYLKNTWLTVLAGILIALVLTLFYYLWRFWKIFRHAEHYKFFFPTTGRPCALPHEDYAYFRVTLENQYGRKINVDTHCIFNRWGIAGPPAKDYVNCIIMIAYNEYTNEVVVIE